MHYTLFIGPILTKIPSHSLLLCAALFLERARLVAFGEESDYAKRVAELHEEIAALDSRLPTPLKTPSTFEKVSSSDAAKPGRLPGQSSSKEAETTRRIEEKVIRIIKAADACDDRKEFRKALSLVEEALEIEETLPTYTPSYSWAAALKATILVSLGRSDEAVALTRDVLRRGIIDKSSCGAVALVYEALGREHEGLALLRAIQVANPGSAHAHYAAALLSYNMGRDGEAEGDIRRAIFINPKSAAYYAWLGEILYKPLAGKSVPMSLGIRYSANAYSAFSRALELDPKNQRARDGIKRIEGNFRLSAIQSFISSVLESAGSGGGMSNEEYLRLYFMDKRNGTAP